MLDGVINGGTELVKAIGLFDTLAQYPQVVRRNALMHGNPKQDGSTGKGPCKAPADVLQEPLPPLVDPTASQVDAQALTVGPGIPMDFDDVGAHGDLLPGT
jgi:hypothetical protein